MIQLVACFGYADSRLDRIKLRAHPSWALQNVVLQGRIDSRKNGGDPQPSSGFVCPLLEIPKFRNNIPVKVSNHGLRCSCGVQRFATSSGRSSRDLVPALFKQLLA